VTKKDEVQALVDKAKEFGKLDVINNAGLMSIAPMSETS
jgi:NADP-dependent 3-hydroxy acid dehydrogenase YdfG